MPTKSRSEMEPQVLRRRDGIQLTYDLPYKTYSTLVYPRRPENGSIVIAIAQEHGVSLIWYGGTGFKSTTPHTHLDGADIDSIQDEPALAKTYGSEDDEFDVSRPFQEVLKKLDVPLDAPAIRIAVPPRPTEQTVEDYPTVLESTVVLAVACSDQSLQLITVPLNPASEGLDDVQIVKVSDVLFHQDLISDIAVTLTADGPVEEHTRAKPRSGSRGRNADRAAQTLPARQWSFLLASVSPTGTGLLIVQQIPLDTSGQISTNPEDHIPVHRRNLRSSSLGGRLAFNPSPFPAERHSHLLIALPEESVVKVYQTLPTPETGRRRRGSTATTDSSLSNERVVRSLSSLTGKPLINLLPPFSPQSVSSLMQRRKSPLDAKWILDGRAVVVLLEDGEWGVWDLEAAGPAGSARSNNLVKGQASNSGIQGGSLTKFALRGLIGSRGSTSKKSSSTTASQGGSTLAPMTPHTRRQKSNGLFKGADDVEQTPNSNNQYPSGAISVSLQMTSASGTSRSLDESLVFNYGPSHLAIPSIRGYWRSESSERGAFESTNSARPVLLPRLNVSDDQPVTAHLFPETTHDSAVAIASSLPFIASMPARISIFVQPVAERGRQFGTNSSLPVRSLASRQATQDQTLLDSGELDVDGMDRILANMTQPSSRTHTMTNGFGKKSVNFQPDEDDDGDVDMDTPTAVRSTKSKLIIQKSSSEGRRLFT